MSILDTAEYRRLALIAAGVDPCDIPCILDTAAWRRLMLQALYDLSQGGGGSPGYINGSVQFYTDLPVTVGTPAVNTAYLVRENSGVWFINRKPAGIYVRLFNNGNLNDWDYAGTFPEVNDSQYFRIYDSADPTREVAFNVSGVAAATTRTISVPDKNILLDDASDPRTPTSHTHGNISNNGQIGTTAGLPVVTTTSGAITTLPLGTANQVLKVNSGGTAVEFGAGFDAASPPAIGSTTRNTGAFTTLSASTSLTLGTSGILSGGTNTIEQRNTTSGQTFRIYNTVSGTADANFERGFVQWTSNNFEIGCEAAGTGTLRNVRIKTDATSGVSGQGYIEFGGSNIINSIKSVGGTAGGALYIFSQSTLRMLIGGSSGIGIYQTIIPLTSLSQDVGTTTLRWRDVFCRSVDLTGNIILPTATGTKIGTGTTQLLGFWNATPATQPAAVADATDAASTQARLNDLLARLRTIGIIAT